MIGNMKNKRIIKEQSGREELEKYFTIPNCFSEDNASIVQVEIDGRTTLAIEKISKDRNKRGYFTADGKIYQADNEDNLIELKGQKWSCDAQKTKLPIQQPVVTARVSPAVQYFNKLNIDLNKPDQIDILNDVILQINRFLRTGAKGESLRNFVYFVNAIKKDPKYDEYVGVTGEKIGNVITEIPQNITQGYNNTTGDMWNWSTNPGADEMNNFVEQTYTINGVPFKFYKWKGSASGTGKVDTGYDPKKCYEELNNYIQSISDASTRPSQQILMNNKRFVEKCYGRFWYDSKLNDKDESGKLKLNLPFGASKNDVQDKLRKLLNRQDETGIRFTVGIQESLDKRLRKALLESIEHKKKAIVESKIIKSRLSVLINENLDYTKKENQFVLMEEVSEEINELKSNGYNMKLVNENFFQWLSSFLGTEQNGSKEYITNWFIKLFDIEPTSRLSDAVSKALENVPESEYGNLFTDCDYTSDLLSKALVEAMMEDMAEDQDSTEVVSGMFKDSIVDTLNQDKISISNRMKEKIHNFVCEKLNKVHINMENTKNEIIDKALS